MFDFMVNAFYALAGATCIGLAAIVITVAGIGIYKTIKKEQDDAKH